MHPYQHAKLCEKRWGSSWKDYMPIHELVDLSASAYPDMRHRMVLHHVDHGATVVRDILTAQGYLAPLMRTSKTGQRLDIREIVRMHVIEDLGRAVEVADWSAEMDQHKLQSIRTRYQHKNTELNLWWRMIDGECVLRWGGTTQFYLQLYNFLGIRAASARNDKTPHHAEEVMMNSFGAHLAELRFGVMYEGFEKPIPIRDVCDYIIRGWWRGYYPSLHDLASRMRLVPWMRGRDILNNGGYKKVIKAHLR